MRFDRIGDRFSSEIEVSVATHDPDVVILVGGVALTGTRRLFGAQLVYITSQSNPHHGRLYILCAAPDIVAHFSEGDMRVNADQNEPEGWTLTALEIASRGGHRFSLMLVDRGVADVDVLDEAERRANVIPSNVTRTFAGEYGGDMILIAAQGSENELVVDADLLREHFVNPDFKLAHAIAAEGESPRAFYDRLMSMLQR